MERGFLLYVFCWRYDPKDAGGKPKRSLLPLNNRTKYAYRMKQFHLMLSTRYPGRWLNMLNLVVCAKIEEG